jgi:hypothetical protein
LLDCQVADKLHGARALLGAGRGCGFAVGVDGLDGLRGRQAREVGVLGLQAGDGRRRLQRLGQRIGLQSIADGDASALADNGAHPHLGVRLGDVLVDARVGEAGQRVVAGGEHDLRLLGRRASEGLFEQALHVVAAQHVRSPSGQRRD